MWKNVTQATADGSTAPFVTAQKRDFIEGFHYRDDLDSTFSPDFFKGFQPGGFNATDNQVAHVRLQ
jgi:hypothetical protein